MRTKNRGNKTSPLPVSKKKAQKVSASFESVEDVYDAPTSIIYLPEGKHSITATVAGQPKTVEVTTSEETLAAIQADFATRQERNVRPTLDFDHKGEGASAIPTGFRYEAGRGVIMDLEWTSAGKSAIEGKVYSYVSPTFLLGADGKPNGLPLRGPLGGLVNNPAFEQIERIAAADATDQLDQENTMDLSEIGLLTANEAAKEDAVTVAAKRVTALKAEPAAAIVEAAAEVQKTLRAAATAADISTEDLATLKVDAAFAPGATLETIGKTFSTALIGMNAQRTEAEKVKVEAGAEWVKSNIAKGRMQVGNDVANEIWLAAYMRDPSKTIEAMDAQPVSFDTKKVIDDPSKQASGSLEAATAKVIEAGRAKTQNEAVVIVMAENPEIYEEYQTANGLA